MSVVIDPMENEVIREWISDGVEKGRAEGRAEGLKKGRAEGYRGVLEAQLRARFGRLPDWAKARLASADADQLRQWGIQLLEAPSLAAVLGEP